MEIKEVLKRELEEISLCSEEEDKISLLVSNTIKTLNSLGLIAKVGGSMSKGTMINKKPQDVDLFVVFKTKEELNTLEEKLKKSNLNFIKLHGSRDYFHIKEEDIIIELIPVIETKNAENAENITDLSLMHVKYILKKLNAKKSLRNEIKLAKAFCYAQDCYGAESYIRGFSGYALELLIIYFGSFVKFLNGIRKIKIIDPEKLYKDKNKIKDELNESKLLSPIILIDPTNKKRNACASLSQETFNKFLEASKKFLAKPSLDYFEKQIMDIDKIQKQAKKAKAKIIQIRLSTERQEGDIAATKMKKLFEFIIKQLIKQEQKVLFKSFSYDFGQEAFGFLSIKEKKEILIKGPSLKLKEAVKSFKLAHKITQNRGRFCYAKKKISLKEIFNSLKHFEDEMGVRFELTGTL